MKVAEIEFMLGSEGDCARHLRKALAILVSDKRTKSHGLDLKEKQQ